MQTLLATLLIALWWTICLIILIGIGRLASRLFGRDLIRLYPLSSWAWIGLVVVVIWAFLVHLVVPLRSPVALVPIVLFAVAGWSLAGEPGSRSGPLVRGLRAMSRPNLIATGLFGMATLFAANFALAQPANFDTYLYHLASIQHYSEYPVIEGLANLHYRLGFQTATFPLAALMEPGPVLGEGFRLVNGFLFVTFGFTLLERASAVLEDRRLSPGTGFLFVAAIVFILMPGSVDSDTVFASPSVDIGTALAFLVAMAAFVDAVCEGLERDDVLVALAVAALAAAFRPQSLPLLGGITLVLAVLWLRSGRGFRGLIPLFVPVAVVTGSWMLHSVVVSGYPVFPFSFPDLGLAWTVPASTVGDASGLITRHGARSGGLSPSLVADPAAFVEWFGGWIEYLRNSGQLPRLALIFFAAAAGLVVMVISKRRRPDLGRLAIISIPALASFLFWLLTSPLVRYGFGPIVAVSSLPISAALFGLRSRALRVPERVLLPASALLVTLLVAVVAIDYGSGRFGLVVKADGDGPLGLKEPMAVELNRVLLPGGRWVFTPVEGSDYCGEVFRCTPDPFRGIRFRGEQLADGLEAYP